MRFFVSIILSIFIYTTAFATHNRAGEITYKQISKFTFEVTITTFTYTLSAADRPELDVIWGDNSTSVVSRIQKLVLPDNYQKNIYVGIHTYPGAGTYQIVVEDPNRNAGVENIPNSVNQVFSIKTTMMINSEIGYNNTPILLNSPVDKAAKGRIYIHNPAAFDIDGDSLSYKLGICTGEYGKEIIGYSLPSASNSFTIDSIIGDLIWDSPLKVGIYNVAIVIEEWRNNTKIGKLVRDMQIEVVNSNNEPPQIENIQDICVIADSVVTFNVKATDYSTENITLTASGGPLYLNDGTTIFEQPKVGMGSVNQTFTWNTNCSHVRKEPYLVFFRAVDNNSSVSLVDIKNAAILVIAPPIQNINTEATNNSIKLTWNTAICTQAKGYNIYRKVNKANFIPNSCQTGVPVETGYKKIASLKGFTNNLYLDNNSGHGLAQGYTYCYIVTSYFDDGAESKASEEVCSDLVRGIPVITNVSVRNTDENQGSMFVAWSKPTEFDSIQAAGPYKYLIYRSEGIWGENLNLIDSLSNINDTIFVDTLINTKLKKYSYKIEFYNDAVGKRFLIGTPQIASSIYLNLTSSDNKISLNIEKNVPWTNSEYIILRQNSTTQTFDSIAQTTVFPFVDDNLKNNVNYCYKIKSIGSYSSSGFINPIINFSQKNCETPIDNEKPCSPNLFLESECDSMKINLKWNNVTKTCAIDVLKYNIYYKPTINGEFELLTSILTETADTLKYSHILTNSISGCYQVASVDSIGNESENIVSICIDSCEYYILPNVFTPNGDGHNDFYVPRPYHSVQKVDMEIYDRWGVLVFKTDNPDLNWDGTNMNNGKTISDGVYFYVCEVFEYRISGVEPRTLTGYIQVLSSTKKSNE